MSMNPDEQDTCRICSAPAEPGQPLYHPCKCSGTIRYIHQDCLTTWLAHSKKKSCDVCKHQYAFTKVYAPNMPEQLPLFLFLRKLVRQLLWTLLVGLRGVLVALMWLTVLPYATVWIWRLYFVMGDQLAWWINASSPLNSTLPLPGNTTTTISVDEDSALNLTVALPMTTFSVWRSISSDIFTGQIIASLIILTFLGAFLLREWIMQNARPGVFEDNLPENARPLDLDAPDRPAAPAQEPMVVNVGPEGALAEDQILDGHRIAIDEEKASHGRDSCPSDGADSGLDLREFTVESGAHTSMPERPRTRRRLSAPEVDVPLRGQDLDRPHRSAQRHRRAPLDGPDKGKTVEHDRRSEPPPSASHSSFLDLAGAEPEFTFTVDPLPPFPGGVNEPSTSASTHFSFRTPYSLKETLGAPSRLLQDDDSVTLDEPSSSTSHLRRPVLPPAAVATPPPEDIMTPIASNSVQIHAALPLPSPSLASYYAPEQMSADIGNEVASDVAEYFESRGPSSPRAATISDETSSDEDLDHYFPEVGAGIAQGGAAVVLEMDSEDEDLEEEWEDPLEAVVAERQVHEGPLEQQAPILPHQLVNVMPAAQEPEDDADGNVDDDVDGALEAIGMRGPIATLFQNAALMIFVLGVTIGLGICLPFTIGKTAALLMLSPQRMLYILHLPIQTIRLITDPVVDIALVSLHWLLHTCLSPITRSLGAIPSLAPLFSDNPVIHSPGSEGPAPFSLPQNLTLNDLFSTWMNAVNRYIATDMSPADPSSDTKLFAATPGFVLLESYFAILGRHVRLSSEQLAKSWVYTAEGDGPMNRIFAIIFGYVIIGFCAAIYLNMLSIGSMQNAGRAIRAAIRQQLVIFKVAIFIVIELFIFPLGCGIMMDLCSLKLFPNSTYRSRAFFFVQAPITAVFYHWMMGTMFMYQFAVLLSGCRNLMRPGALWFIKDPQDQNFHPIRDILERPTFMQLRKLAISALMYSVVVGGGMGTIVILFRLWGSSLVPLRWNIRQPLSSLPLDLLFLHIALPLTLHHFRPRRGARTIAAMYWSWAARQFRLTSYMYGGRHPDEEMAPPSWPLVTSAKGEIPTDSKLDGEFRRVPATDDIPHVKCMKTTVLVDEKGEGLDEESKKIIEEQIEHCEKSGREVKEDFTTVYIPPHFRQRVFAFILLTWLVFSTSLVAAIAIPIYIGRLVFALYLNREVHDGYSLLLGTYMLWGCFVAARTLDRMDKRRQRSSEEPRAPWLLYVAKRSLPYLASLIWMAFWLGIVIPVLLDFALEAYCVLPLRMLLSGQSTTKLRVIESWAVGLVYMRVLLSTSRFRPENRLDQAIAKIRLNGFRRLDVGNATMDLILPLTGALLGIILVPPSFVSLLKHVLLLPVPERTLLLSIYPGLAIVLVAARVARSLGTLFQSWTQSIRDSEFLLEMRLINHEQTPKQDAPAAANEPPIVLA